MPAILQPYLGTKAQLVSCFPEHSIKVAISFYNPKP